MSLSKKTHYGRTERELGGMRGVAETMTANVRSVINRKRERNPEEYKKFSERINRLLTELQAGTIEYRKFLQEIKLLSDELRQGNTSDARLDNAAKKDLCDNLGGNAQKNFVTQDPDSAKWFALVDEKDRQINRLLSLLEKEQESKSELERKNDKLVDALINQKQ